MKINYFSFIKHIVFVLTFVCISVESKQFVFNPQNNQNTFNFHSEDIWSPNGIPSLDDSVTICPQNEVVIQVTQNVSSNVLVNENCAKVVFEISDNCSQFGSNNNNDGSINYFVSVYNTEIVVKNDIKKLNFGLIELHGNSLMRSEASLKLHGEHLKIYTGSSLKGSISIVLSGELVVKGDLEVSSVDVGKLVLPDNENDVLCKANGFVFREITGRGVILGDIAISNKIEIPSNIIVNGQVDVVYINLNSFFKQITMLNIVQSTINTEECTVTNSTIISTSVLKGFIFQGQIQTSGENSLDHCSSNYATFTLSQTSTLYFNQMVGNLTTTNGNIVCKLCNFKGEIDSHLSFEEKNALEITYTKDSMMFYSNSYLTSSQIHFTQLQSFTYPAEKSTFTFDKSITISSSSLNEISFKTTAENIYYQHYETNNKITIQNEFVKLENISNDIQINKNLIQSNKNISADSLIQQSEESLQIQCNQQSQFNINQFIIRSIQLNDCLINQTKFILSYEKYVETNRCSLSNTIFDSSHSLLSFVNSEINSIQTEGIIHLINSTNITNSIGSTIYCHDNHSIESVEIKETIFVNEKSQIEMKKTTFLSLENKGIISLQSNGKYQKIKNYPNSILSLTSSGIYQIEIENYGEIRITQNTAILQFLNNSKNVGIIKGNGEIEIHSIYFINGGYIDYKLSIINSTFALYQNSTFQSSLLIKDSSVYLFDSSPVIQQIIYEGNCFIPKALKTKTTICRNVNAIESFKIEAEEIQISNSNFISNEIHLQSLNGSISSSYFTSLFLKDCNVKLTKNKIVSLSLENTKITDDIEVENLYGKHSQIESNSIAERYEVLNTSMLTIQVKQTGVSLINQNDENTNNSYLYSTINGITQQGVINFYGAFILQNFEFDGSFINKPIIFNEIIQPFQLINMTIKSMRMNAIITYKNVILQNSIIQNVINYGILHFEESEKNSISSLTLKSNSLTYSPQQLTVNSLITEDNSYFTCEELTIGKQFVVDSTISLSILYLLDGSYGEGKGMITVDHLIGSYFNHINFPVTVKKSCSNIRSTKEFILSNEFIGNCKNSNLRLVNNFGHFYYIKDCCVQINNYNTTFVTGEMNSNCINYGSILLNEVNQTSKMYTNSNQNKITGNGTISFLREMKLYNEQHFESQIFVEKKIRIDKIQQGNYHFHVKVHNDSNDLVTVGDYKGSRLYFSVELDDFIPPRGRIYTIFMNDIPMNKTNIPVKIKGVTYKSPWRVVMTQVSIYLEYLGCSVIYNTSTKLCEICKNGEIFDKEGYKCNGCPTGQILSGGKCISCKEGTYKDGFYCKKCPKNAYSPKESDECYECPFGQIVSSTNDKCEKCPLGMHFKQTENSRYCTWCERGTFRNESFVDSTICIPCPVGSYSPRFNLTNCYECPKGYYQNEEGQTNCKQCPNGTITSMNGMKKCEKCPEGYWPSKNRDKCMTCQAGQERSLFGCYYCQPGYYKNTTGEKCLPCPENMYQSYGGMKYCEKCEGKMWYVNDNKTQCVKREIKTNTKTAIPIYSTVVIVIVAAVGFGFLLLFLIEKENDEKRIKLKIKNEKERGNKSKQKFKERNERLRGINYFE